MNPLALPFYKGVNKRELWQRFCLFVACIFYVIIHKQWCVEHIVCFHCSNCAHFSRNTSHCRLTARRHNDQRETMKSICQLKKEVSDFNFLLCFCLSIYLTTESYWASIRGNSFRELTCWILSFSRNVITMKDYVTLM